MWSVGGKAGDDDDDDEMCLRGRELVGRPVQAATVDRPAGGGTAGGAGYRVGRNARPGQFCSRAWHHTPVGSRQPGRRVSHLVEKTTSSSPAWSSDE